MPNERYPNGTNTSLWYKLVHLNPAVFKALVSSVIALAAAFGVIISPEIPDAVLGVIVVLWPLLQGLWTKGSVTPNAKVLAFLPKPTEQPSVVYPGDAVTTAPDKVIVEAVRTAA